MSGALKVGVSFGHGGNIHTPGCPREGVHCNACGTRAGADDGIVEAAFAREVGEEFVARLPSDICDVVELNGPTETVSPVVRGTRARDARCDVVIAVHVNESASSRTTGCHAMYIEGDVIGSAMALAIAESWPSALRRDIYPSRKSYSANAPPVYIAGGFEAATPDLWPRAHALLMAYAPIPTVLVETFYASNPRDRKFALNHWTQTGMACSMALGVCRAGVIAR